MQVSYIPLSKEHYISYAWHTSLSGTEVLTDQVSNATSTLVGIFGVFRRVKKVSRSKQAVGHDPAESRNNNNNNNNTNIIIIIIIIIQYVSLLSQAFLPGTSLEPAVIPTAQASSFTLQYFPYYV